MIGYIGTGLLLIAYICYTFKKEWFIPINIAASFTLTLYAIILRDIPFIVVNILITAILIINLIKNDKKL